MSEPNEIKKLDQSVINKIAAGEIIQRPANALKELIENSLDAKSTNIQITVKNGGLKLLQIQDNGTGIRKEDFKIVCERFTTSKLREFEDLQKIATYGFRGEALASISHIAHLTITSKTSKEICAFKASYTDGKLKEPPKAIAGNQGTIITVEDLFYNMNVRRKALRSPAEEYQKIAEVVSKYSVHNYTVGFSLKKSAEHNDIRTPPNSTCVENIRILYGNSIARELIEFSFENQPLRFKANGYITNVNYSTKKLIFLLFINHRLVDCQSLKRCVDQVYATYLPKNMHPFIYLSIELDPSHVDVNVHPTKHEVHFLNEEQIVEALTKALETKLLGSNNSRMFYTQSKLPNVHIETFDVKDGDDKKDNKVTAAKNMIRTDANNQKLDKFFGTPVRLSETNKLKPSEEDTIKQNLFLWDSPENRNNTFLNDENYQAYNEELLDKNVSFETKLLDKSPVKNNRKKDNPFETECSTSKQQEEQVLPTEIPDVIMIEDCEKDDKKELHKEIIGIQSKISKEILPKITRIETELTSVIELRKSIEDNCHNTLRQVFAQHVFVGSIDTEQALIQHSTKLYLCNTKKILQELFYQYILYNFQNFDLIVFSEPLPIYELALLALDLPEVGWTEEDGDKKELSQKIASILTEKSEMLNEYFGMEIDDKGNLKSIPQLLELYMPDIKVLPVYIVRLATEVNWEVEKECFDNFAKETGWFYSHVSEENDSNGNDWKWITEHLIYPAIKNYFIPPKSFTKNAAILEIASLPDLYKVFERC